MVPAVAMTSAGASHLGQMRLIVLIILTSFKPSSFGQRAIPGPTVHLYKVMAGDRRRKHISNS
jgi:hypothetical protein